MINNKDLPIGVNIEDSYDMHGVPEVKLIIECANEDIAKDYFWNAEQALRLKKIIEDRLKDPNCYDYLDGVGEDLYLKDLLEESKKNE